MLDETHGLSILYLWNAHPLDVTLLSHIHLVLLGGTSRKERWEQMRGEIIVTEGQNPERLFLVGCLSSSPVKIITVYNDCSIHLFDSCMGKQYRKMNSDL